VDIELYVGVVHRFPASFLADRGVVDQLAGADQLVLDTNRVIGRDQQVAVWSGIGEGSTHDADRRHGLRRRV
jgi:hypothetical protein